MARETDDGTACGREGRKPWKTERVLCKVRANGERKAGASREVDGAKVGGARKKNLRIGGPGVKTRRT